MFSFRKNRIESIIISVVIFLVAAYILSGLYTLESGESALVLRFGNVVNEVTESGIHYHLPFPFETTIKAGVSEVKTISIQKDYENYIETFTGDENLIIVNAIVSFDIKNLTDYYFNISDPEKLINVVFKNVFSSEITALKVDDVMSSGKAVLRLTMKELIQKQLDYLGAGVRVISIELTDISPPDPVALSFESVSDARVKKQAIIKDAEGYANSIIPKARGKADSLFSDAEAYALERTKTAKSEINAFEKLLVEYNRNPSITKKIKYLELIRTLNQRCKITIDSDPAKSTYYIGNNGFFPAGD